jgi:hypothetical protein
MKLIDIINPWDALRRAHDETRYYGARVEADTRKVEKKAHEIKVSDLKAEIKRLEKIIAEGHYRNPKTGRLGRKGEVFTK